MRFSIEPQRDLALIDADLGGWGGLLPEGETKFEKCLDDRAEIFALFASDTGLPGTSELVNDYPTREQAQAAIEEIIIRDGLSNRELSEHLAEDSSPYCRR